MVLREGFREPAAVAGRFSSTTASEPILSAGKIKIAMRLDPKLKERRDTAIKKLEHRYLMGNDLGYNYEYLKVQIRSPCLMQAKTPKSDGMEHFFPGRGIVTPCLNGQYLPGLKHGMDQDEFEREWRFFGFFDSTKDYGYGQASTDEVAVVIAGSGSTENNGTTEILTGDPVEYALPSIDWATREKELENLPDLVYRSKQVLGPIFRKQTYETATRFFNNGLRKTFEEQEQERVFNYTAVLDPYQKNALPDRFRFGLSMRAWANYAALIGILTAAQFNLVTLNPDVIASAVAGTVAPVPRRPFTPEEQLLADGLTRLHGFGEANEEGHPLLMLTQILRIHHAFLGQELYDEGELDELYPAAPPQTRFDATLDSLFRPRSTIERMKIAQQAVGIDLYRNAVMAKLNVDSKRCFVALNNALPGGTLNYLLTIH
jgi:hypothetical protein